MPTPEFWTAAADLLLVTSAILSGFAAAYARRATKGAESATREAAGAHYSAHRARVQVENSHSTNLRDDLDAIRDQLDAMQERSDATHEALWRAIHGEPSPPPPTGPISTTRKERSR